MVTWLVSSWWILVPVKTVPGTAGTPADTECCERSQGLQTKWSEASWTLLQEIQEHQGYHRNWLSSFPLGNPWGVEENKTLGLAWSSSSWIKFMHIKLLLQTLMPFALQRCVYVCMSKIPSPGVDVPQSYTRMWGKIEVGIIEQSMGDVKYGNLLIILTHFWRYSNQNVTLQKEGLKELTFKVNIDYEN